MPHITIEYSTNVADLVDIDELVDVVHNAALRTGIAPLAGLRTRTEPRDHYRVADGHPDNSFLAIWARLAPRPPEDKTRFIEEVLAAVTEFLGAATNRMAISMEMHDIDTEFRINSNDIRRHIS